MNDYYYSQKYSGYGYQGIGEPTMAQKGCVVTSLAMILSYYNDKAFYPDQLLKWARDNGMLMANGDTIWQRFLVATGNRLRMSMTPTLQGDENVVYGLRQVWFGSQVGNEHWVIDHPHQKGKIIDPWDGQVKDYGSQKYTGRNYYFIGKK